MPLPASQSSSGGCSRTDPKKSQFPDKRQGEGVARGRFRKNEEKASWATVASGFRTGYGFMSRFVTCAVGLFSSGLNNKDKRQGAPRTETHYCTSTRRASSRYAGGA